jgi:hypothetical protein
MRAKTKGKHEIRKRFAIVIGVAAAGVMALGVQTAAAEPVDTSPQLASTVTAPSSDPVKEIVVLRPTRQITGRPQQVRTAPSSGPVAVNIMKTKHDTVKNSISNVR